MKRKDYYIGRSFSISKKVIRRVFVTCLVLLTLFLYFDRNSAISQNHDSGEPWQDDVADKSNGDPINKVQEVDEMVHHQFEAMKEAIQQSTLEFLEKSYENKGKKPKACFVSLVRSSEMDALAATIKVVQEKFNDVYNYDWVFLNDEPFEQFFKDTIKSLLPNSMVRFGTVPKEHWSYPDYIDQGKAARARVIMQHQDIPYGGSESYRHMCRYQSGFFWRHPLLDNYDWYWRVEPDTRLLCDINFDVFRYMQDNHKAYGFTVSIHEYEETIPTLWDTTMKFFQENPQHLAPNNLMSFLSNDDGKTYNMCHFWSNFEVANLNLWRSPGYREYFDYLDHAGGFFYERWGDAPVHSIAAALLLPRDMIHFFDTIGYRHIPFEHCPIDPQVWTANNCQCDKSTDFTFQMFSCGAEYYDAQGMEKPSAWVDYRGL